MYSTSIKQLEVEELQRQTGLSLNNLHDLRVVFYQGQTGLTTTNEHDLIKAFLQAETGLSLDSLIDMWRVYMIARGVPDYISIDDMFRYFYANVGFNAGYAFSRSITIQNAKVDGSVALTDYPLLFSGTYAYLATAANGGDLENANGYDFVFSSDAEGSTLLDYEVVSHNLTTGEVEIWVKVPSVAHDVDTVIYIHYGDADVTTSQANPTAVWTGYNVVSHMNNVTTSTVKDSTVNNHALTKTGAGEPLEVAGKVGRAQHFDGSNDAITSPDASTLEPTQVTLSAWVNLDTLPGAGQFATVIRKYATAGYFLRINSAGIGQISINNGALRFVVTTSAFTTGNWIHLAGSYNTSGVLKVFFNGVEQASSTLGSGNIAHDSDPLNIGLRSTDRTDGLIDEVRIFGGVLTPARIKTEYENQNDPSTFYVISNEL